MVEIFPVKKKKKKIPNNNQLIIFLVAWISVCIISLSLIKKRQNENNHHHLSIYMIYALNYFCSKKKYGLVFFSFFSGFNQSILVFNTHTHTHSKFVCLSFFVYMTIYGYLGNVFYHFLFVTISILVIICRFLPYHLI